MNEHTEYLNLDSKLSHLLKMSQMSIKNKMYQRTPLNENICTALKLAFGIYHFRKLFLNVNFLDIFTDFDKEFSLSGPRQQFSFILLCKTDIR